LYEHDFVFKPDAGSVTLHYEVVKTSTGWRIKGPEPNPPDLSVDSQIEALLFDAGDQHRTPEYRKQADATAKLLSRLAHR
jgi:hypothetical protein